jgi:tight adherence protein C
MPDFIVPLLTFMSVVCIGGAVLVLRGARRRTLESRLFPEQSARLAMLGGTMGSPGQGHRMVEALEQVGRAVSQSTDIKSNSDLRERLVHAGFYEPAAATIYTGAQLMMVVLAIPLAGLVALALNLSLILALCVVLVGVAVSGLLPNLYIKLRCNNRRNEVRRQLPDAIDLLEICVSSGMGLDMAWNAVCDDFRGVSTVLADEMSLATLEMHLGAPRAQALRNMARRTGVEDISSLVATLVQSERFGTSVSQALRVYAEAMRKERSQRAEEAAEKLTVKMLFPMVLFIFPCVFIVILGPAGIKIAEMFAGD